MGIFNFVKHVGEKLGVIDNNQDQQQSSNMLQSILQKTLDHYQNGNDNMKVKIDGDQAHLSGDVDNHSELEKAILAIGNTMGIGSVNSDHVRVKNPESHTTPSQFYEVKSGDTLWKIAEKMYGKGEKDKEIFHANTPMLSSPDKIFPGQILRIPAVL